MVGNIQKLYTPIIYVIYISSKPDLIMEKFSDFCCKNSMVHTNSMNNPALSHTQQTSPINYMINMLSSPNSINESKTTESFSCHACSNKSFKQYHNSFHSTK